LREEREGCFVEYEYEDECEDGDGDGEEGEVMGDDN
jgi:hypothetical protein